jgi:3-hydroxyethyl bacteriochlorophyllide a dehydrogenase
VFVPGARCFGEVRGLFGGAASRLVVPGAGGAVSERLGERGVLLALAATAYHACRRRGPPRASTRPTSSSATACWAA